MKKVFVLGAGTMGAGIVQAFAQKGCEVIVRDIKDKDLEHILVLAKEKNVQVEEYPLKAYKCCGIIKNMRDI